ncbi:MAG: S8 family serine peptidase [Planctomycetes bacterium]|nr:S8 family serine peptidase [Planctomycetota bacterium]
MICALLLLALGAQQTSVPSISDQLQTVMEMAPTEHHRVYIKMDSHLDFAYFQSKTEGMRKSERREFVVNELKAFADQSQQQILQRLSNLQTQAHVSGVRQLWICNSIQLHADATAIEQLADMDGVAEVRYDPIRDPAELHDVPLAAPQQQASSSQKGGNNSITYYYGTSFEAGLGAEWATAVTGCGRVQLTAANGPYHGSQHLTMDSHTDGCYGTVTATLTVDLSAATTAEVRYALNDYYDELNIGSDILQASDDGGANWVKVADLTGTDGAYTLKIHSLDGLGLTYGPNFKIRWSWYDNYSIATDGFGLDAIQIADAFPPPPPPSPEQNLIQLQAPDLWAIGVTGAGANLLNIDSGVDYTHPDLINRIWQNPADPADGVDNDGNGYVDDVMGWDWELNDNDPYPSANHGTATAGIMVGDGSAGVYLTGMAPGASLAIARISGEGDHWAAQQWALTVGMDCSSSSHSYKWYFNPKPDYHHHRLVEDMVLAAGVIHANSIGNSFGDPSAPIPFNISAPGLVPSPWRHPDQVQADGGVSGVMACGGIELDDSHYGYSSEGPSAWEDLTTYQGGYAHSQDPANWDYPVGGWSGSGQGLLKPDVVTYTNVVTTDNGGGYLGSFGGTSAATPHLGGALALMVSANPEALPRQICEALQITAEDLGAPGKDNLFGAGKVQVKDAALRLMHLVTAQDSTPSINSNAQVGMTGPADQPYGLFYGLSLGSTVIPGYGTLGIQNAKLVKQGNLGAAGFDTASAFIPNNAGLVGTKVYTQSICDDSSGASGEILFSLIEVMTIAP